VDGVVSWKKVDFGCDVYGKTILLFSKAELTPANTVETNRLPMYAM
jgi:hypothetical protein